MHYTLPKTLFIFWFSTFFFCCAHASEIRLEASKVNIRTNEEFSVDLVVSNKELINALGGRVVFPEALLEVKEIRDGNSIIHVWIERPQLSAPGEIVFSGITPGGFVGADNKVLSILFEAKQEALAPISVLQVQAFRNDGSASEIGLSIRDTVVEIKPGDSRTRKEILYDHEKPEPFLPIIASDNSMFNGEYFVVFGTQDKGSGIKQYEIREGRWGRYQEATSPYHIRAQKLNTDIYIKAIDNAGNERLVIVPAPAPLFVWKYYGLFAILIGMIVVATVLYKKRHE